MRAFVTGATGHIGRSLTSRLLSTDNEVAILARPSSPLERLGEDLKLVRVVHGDLADAASLQAALAAAKPDVVFHLAWFGVNRASRSDERQVELNLLGSLNLFQAARRACVGCFIGLGSQAEYGPIGGVLNEESPTRPTTLYGAAKLAVGALTLTLGQSFAGSSVPAMRCAWIRLLATYGPFDHESHLIPTVIKSLLSRQKPLLTSGRQKWDYLFVDDAAEALQRVASVPDANGLFVLGSGEAHTVQEIAETIRQLVDPELPLGLGELPEDRQQTVHLQADTTRLRSITGWRPSTPLIDGLRRTIIWYKARLVRASVPT